MPNARMQNEGGCDINTVAAGYAQIKISHAKVVLGGPFLAAYDPVYSKPLPDTGGGRVM